jgi:agmatine/peptidylarginine deiminase
VVAVLSEVDVNQNILLFLPQIFRTMKKALSIFTLLLLMATTMQAQDANSQKKPDWARWHYLSEAEMYDHSRGMNFVETDPPAGEPRFVAEFEPMQGVMIRYPLGIPTSLVVQLANNCHVYCVVSSSYQNQAQNSFQNAGVNMSNVTFVNAPTDSYWIRDYGPWYIFEDRNPAIVDNVYNRPRPYDDEISGVFANFWNIPMYGMNLEHTGGNMMEDGRGHGVSDNLVLQENNNNETNVRNKMRDYLGIDPYHITIDPQGDYIAHVDCWGKYLAPDKILIARVPQSNSHYNDYESVAQYFETTNCCWGYPYRVYRVDEPGGYTLAPYTNSLILNKTVYVPLGTNSTYNNNALAVYQEAMPGYEIVGVNGGSAGWENTDALHCRTRGVMDFNMLFVDHRNVLFGEQDWQDSIAVTSKFIAYSGANLKQDSLLVYYSIDGGAYQVAHMTATGNPDEYVGYIKGYQGESEINYYVFGADESGHRYTQPVFADLDPHHFTMEAHEVPQGELIITPDTLWFNQMGVSQEFVINNETTDAVTIYSVVPEQPSLNIWEPSFPYTLQPGQSVTVTIDYQPAPGKDNYNAYDILISTSLGERHVTAMVLQTAMDAGLVVVGAPVIELEDFNADYRQLQNRNFGTLTPIKIISIEEQETDYLIVEPQHTLPYVMDAGEYFEIGVRLNPDRSIKGYVTTTVLIESNDRQCEIAVSINEDLLNVTELSAETKLYPNPTTGQFTVEGANVAKVEVYNLVGQKVYEHQGSKVVNIDATEWNKGIYLVNIIEENGAVVTKKLVMK